MSDLLNGLNPMQKQAVLLTEGPLLLLAGAGSGKTRVLTHRIAYLIEQGVRPFNILAITFTNKAAKEMRERVEAISEQGKDVWVSTFHSSCVRILRREIERLGYTSKFTIYDSDDTEKLIREICKEMNINDKYFTPKGIMSEISNQKNELISATAFSKKMDNDYRLETISKIYTEYQRRLRKNNALDFDDLIFKTVQLFAQNPDVLEKYRERFKYIMVDEYQDTNTCQYSLIRLLSSKYKNICVVGDDDQSIYGWRGANIRNILEFEKDFKNAQTIKLEQNYRSTETILDAANAVIKNNMGRKQKQLWTENKKGTPIRFHRGSSDLEEALFISSEIEKKVKDGAKYSDFAILYRNNYLSRSIEDRLVKSSIPYRLFGGTPFYSRKEIKDIISYLKILYNPTDEIALKRIINVPKRGIGDTTVERLSQYAESAQMTFFEVMFNLNDIPELKSRSKKISDFANLIKDLQNDAAEMNICSLIENVLEKTGYTAELIKEGTDEALNRIENIQELVSKAAEFEQSAEDATLSAFLEEVALVADIDNYSESDETVILMTLHSSKGLEFPTVFIVGFEDGIFPSYRSTMDTNPNAMEEERRLCYVGITRAKEKLYITCAKSRLQHGQYIANAPSRFFKEIPKDYLDIDIIPSSPNAEKSEKQKITSPKTVTKYGSDYAKNYSSYAKMPTPKNTNLDFEVGDTVKQLKYGKGTVVSISPAGADFEVTVDFPKIGTKKFMAMLSKLKKV